MKPLFYLFLFIVFYGCKAKYIEVPIKTIKTEYKDRIRVDSILLVDSVFIDRYKKGDTIFLKKEKFKYIYKDRIVTDTIIVTDSIQVPIKVKETKEVKAPYSWLEKMLMFLGCVAVGIVGFSIYRKF